MMAGVFSGWNFRSKFFARRGHVYQRAAQQIVGRERRERVSHHDWSGDA
jgi:hypothetical protein